MKVLLVEDDPQKLQIVAAMLRGLAISGLEIDSAHNAAQAKKELGRVQYDIMILDVALPLSAETKPHPSGGLELLRVVTRGTRFLKPKEIIGLTAYSALLEEAGDNFSRQLWTLVHFDPASEAWAEQTKAKVLYLHEMASEEKSPAYECELCVITALTDPELKALLRLGWKWKKSACRDDVSQYWEGEFSRDGELFRVVAACASRMGMPASTALAMKMICKYRPKYLAMIGIAAGVRGGCSLGDVLVADPSWDWGSGKFVDVEGKTVFEAAPDQLSLDGFLKVRISALSQDNLMLEGIRSQWQGETVNTLLRLHIGPVASGAAVLADQEHTAVIRAQHRKVIGIDMEAYGVFAAATEASRPQPLPLVIKGVVDFADKEKADSYQAYAAYASAAVLEALVTKYL